MKDRALLIGLRSRTIGTRIDFAGTGNDWEKVEIKEKNELLTDGSVQIYCAE